VQISAPIPESIRAAASAGGIALPAQLR
jgi:hypothetical protein